MQEVIEVVKPNSYNEELEAIIRLPYRGYVISITTVDHKPALAIFDNPANGDAILHRHEAVTGELVLEAMAHIDVLIDGSSKLLIGRKKPLPDPNPTDEDLEWAKITRGEVLRHIADYPGLSMLQPWRFLTSPVYRRTLWLWWHGFVRIDWRMRTYTTHVGDRALELVEKRNRQ